MNRYEIDVHRVEERCASFTVLAESEADAIEMAHDDAGDSDYGDKKVVNVDYQHVVMNVGPVDPSDVNLLPEEQMDRTVTLSKHEVVVDRDWLEGIAKKLASNKDLGPTAMEIQQVASPDEEEEEEESLDDEG